MKQLVKKIQHSVTEKVFKAKDQNAVQGLGFGGALTTRSGIDVRAASMRWASYRWVVVFTLLAAIYYGLFASDQYVTQSQLYVKSTKGAAVVLPNLSMFGGGSGEAQDALLLKSYILSSDMLHILDDRIGVKAHFSSDEWDWYARLEDDPPFEDFHKYYQSKVGVHIQPNSSVVEVTVMAFTPEYAQQLSQEILRASDDYINSIGQQIAKEEIGFIETQLGQYRAQLDAARKELLEFQNEKGVLSPQSAGSAFQSIIQELETEQVRLEMERKVLASYLNETAPQVVSIDSRINSIEAQVEQERAKIGGAGNQSINMIKAEYDVIEQRFQFAKDLYQSTLASLEQARLESYHKLKHLVIIQAPLLPDTALEPRKLYNLTTLFILLSLAYGVITMILATIREHRDV